MHLYVCVRKLWWNDRAGKLFDINLHNKGRYVLPFTGVIGGECNGGSNAPPIFFLPKIFFFCYWFEDG